MGMALKHDVIAQACRMSGTAKPVDLVHLSIQTMGDQDLERSVLEIFVKQSTIYLQQLQEAHEEDVRKGFAHQLKGAARGIGAWELARIAEEAEKPGFSDIAAIESEIVAVCDYIRTISVK